MVIIKMKSKRSINRNTLKNKEKGILKISSNCTHQKLVLIRAAVMKG
jgi:hypothetical protein